MLKAKRTTRAKRQAEQWCSYLFEIQEVHAHYSYSDGTRFSRTAQEEHLQPRVNAICRAPTKLQGRRTDFVLIGDRQHELDLRSQSLAPASVTGVGTLTMRGTRSDYLGSLPYDAAWHVAPMVLSGAFRFIYLHGATLSRGTARIKSISFYHEFDLEDV